MTTASLMAPRRYAGVIEALRRYRLMVGAVTALYLVTYLWSIGDIVVTATDQSRFGVVPPIQVAADWPARLLRQTAPFTYEPVLTAHLTAHIQLFPWRPSTWPSGCCWAGSPRRQPRGRHPRLPTCRRRSFAGLLGVLPGFLTGFACCAPTLTLLLGAQVAAGLTGLRNWLFPLALAMLLAGLAWSTKRLAGRGPPTDPGVPVT